MAESSALTTATNIIASPNEAFASIKTHPTIWLPLLLLIVGYTAISMTYMNSVDIGWFVDQQLQASTADLTDEQREQATARAASISPMVLGAIGSVTGSIVIVLWLFLYSLYLTGVSFATNDGVKLKQWFALMTWCALPILLGIIAQIVNVEFRDARFLAQDEINPLSFRNLLSIDTAGLNAFQRVLLGIDPTTLWSLILSIFGYQFFTNRSVGTSATIVLAPVVLIVAIGVLITLL